MATMTAAQALEEAARIFERQLWPLTSGERDAVDHIRALASRLAEQEQNNAAGQGKVNAGDGSDASSQARCTPTPAAPSAREVAEKCAEIVCDMYGYSGEPRDLVEVTRIRQALRAYAATLPSPQPESVVHNLLREIRDMFAVRLDVPYPQYIPATQTFLTVSIRQLRERLDAALDGSAKRERK